MKLNKILAVALASLTCLSSMTAFAASSGSSSDDISVGRDDNQSVVTKYGEFGVDTNPQTDVYLTVDGKGVVAGVPTSIVLSGTVDKNGKHIGQYSVSAWGDMAGNEVLNIQPETSTVTLKQTGKSDMTADIEQAKRYFTYKDVQDNVVADGIISAEGLHAGSWNGNFNFTIGMRTVDAYDALSAAQLLAKNKDIVTYDDYDLFEHGSINIASNRVTVTNNLNDAIISPELLYLPYGSAFKIDIQKLIDMGYNKGNPDIRLYSYDENGNYIGEITESYFAPSEDNVDGDFRPSNFVVTDKNGIYVRIRWVKWDNTFTEQSRKDLQSALFVHSLTAIGAEVFDNSTLTQCWENEAEYEAWPAKCIFFNKTDNLYYAYYPSQPGHTDYTGKILCRTSSDLVNWSNSETVWDGCVNEFIASMDGALQAANGDIVISLLADNISDSNKYIKTRFLRSTDNGVTWEVEHFILDGEDVDAKYRMQRPRVMEDGRIFAGYFDNEKKEKTGICYSEDNGHTWVSSDFSSKVSLSDNGEYDFTMLNNGNILCVQRQNGDGVGVSVTISTDNGKSFINETSLHFVDSNSQMVNCPFIRYDKETDRLTIYEVDRFKSGGLVAIYTSGQHITDFLLNGAEFKGFQANVCSLGLNGNADMGYCHIIDGPDGTAKCFYYNRTNQTANTASWYSVSIK